MPFGSALDRGKDIQPCQGLGQERVAANRLEDIDMRQQGHGGVPDDRLPGQKMELLAYAGLFLRGTGREPPPTPRRQKKGGNASVFRAGMRGVQDGGSFSAVRQWVMPM